MNKEVAELRHAHKIEKAKMQLTISNMQEELDKVGMIPELDPWSSPASFWRRSLPLVESLAQFASASRPTPPPNAVPYREQRQLQR